MPRNGKRGGRYSILWPVGRELVAFALLIFFARGLNDEASLSMP